MGLCLSLGACQQPELPPPPEAGDSTTEVVALPDPEQLDPDSDILLLFPATDRETYLEMWGAMADWIAHRVGQGRSLSGVPLYAILESLGRAPTDSVSAEEIRLFLAAQMSARRVADTPGGRYLGILALGSLDVDPDAAYPPIPHHLPSLAASGELVETDVLYGYTDDPSDWSEGAMIARDALAFDDPMFLVFRAPITGLADFEHFAGRAIEFEAAEYRRDVALVAGQVTSLPGDTAALQCEIERRLGAVDDVGAIHKVFDADICDPDYLVTDAEHRLIHFMSDADSDWAGGTIFNLSHGNGTSIYYGIGGDEFRGNLNVTDVDLMPGDKLNIFVALSCSVDEPLANLWNLNRVMYEQGGSVATATATANTYAEGLDDVQIGQLEALPRWLGDHQPMALALHEIRSDYYREVVLKTTDPESADLFWLNLVAFGVTGDGLVDVSP